MKTSFAAVYAGLGLALLASCGHDQPAVTETTPTAPETPAAGPATVAAPVPVLTSADVVTATDHDTLRTSDGQTVSVQRTTLAVWQKAQPDPLPALPDSVDSPTIAQTGGRVQRLGQALTFKAANGRTVTLQNDTTDGEDAVVYMYWGSLPKAHQWVANAWLYEGRAVVLIDQRTGQRTNIWGHPSTSPDGQYILASSSDLVATFDPNGFQLLQIRPGGPQLVWQRELANWGPAAVRWRADGSAVVKQEFGPTESGADLPPRYVSLRLPPARP
ncbi:hypothetical protein LGH70_15085 [Hymenobacter sp. BT635]|uniref:Bulb-type lectin domain-containing protein n=1 Tax=Hymenobacter nitidus TaxID=2880929 RepID=A0ABS8AEV3_9BACT|nr:hypothetical protein [Hymenobacter nitidus]MCB2378923.1 hypothetical protein [Hymenobacter nitidus]